MEFEIKKKNGLSTIIAYLVIFNLISIIVTLAVANIFNNFGMSLNIKDNYNTASSLINLLVYVILIIAVLFINYKELVGDFKEFISKKDNIILKVLAGYGIFYVINIFCSVLISNIEIYGNFMNNVLGNGKEIITTADNQTAIEEILSSNGMWMMFLSAGILGPICEEVVFRKAFFNVCKTKEMGILLSSLCFGLIHITSSIGMYDLYSTILMTMPYIFSGIAFGILYIKNDCNIMVPTIVHMLSNIVSMVGIIFLV